jgi:hypothetical protein
MALKRVTHTRPPSLSCARRVGGRGGCEEALAVRPGETAASADLGGSSKYSNENFED